MAVSNALATPDVICCAIRSALPPPNLLKADRSQFHQIPRKATLRCWSLASLK